MGAAMQQTSPSTAFVFIVYILLVTILMSNLMIGIIIDLYQEVTAMRNLDLFAELKNTFKGDYNVLEMSDMVVDVLSLTFNEPKIREIEAEYQKSCREHALKRMRGSISRKDNFLRTLGLTRIWRRFGGDVANDSDDDDDEVVMPEEVHNTIDTWRRTRSHGLGPASRTTDGSLSQSMQSSNSGRVDRPSRDLREAATDCVAADSQEGRSSTRRQSTSMGLVGSQDGSADGQQEASELKRSGVRQESKRRSSNTESAPASRDLTLLGEPVVALSSPQETAEEQVAVGSPTTQRVAASTADSPSTSPSISPSASPTLGPKSPTALMPPARMGLTRQNSMLLKKGKRRGYM